MALNIIVDANSIGWACQHSTKLSVDGQQTQAIFGFVKTMRQLRMNYPEASILVLWDGKAEFRYDLYPGYKADRHSTDKQKAESEAYHSQVPHIQRAVTALGISQVRVSDLEADDLAGVFVKRFMSKEGNTVLLITGDQDWAQLVREGVTWRDPREDDRIITIHNFFEKTGYKTPLAFLEGKCLHGDSSDKITGVGGIGEGTAPLLLAEHGSIRNFIKKCEEGTYVPKTKAERSLWKGTSPYTKEEWEAQFIYIENPELSDVENEKARKKALKQHKDNYIGQGRNLFKRNLALMQLLIPREIDKSKLVVTKGAFDREQFADLCGEFAFMSILKSLDNFLQPFN